MLEVREEGNYCKRGNCVPPPSLDWLLIAFSYCNDIRSAQWYHSRDHVEDEGEVGADPKPSCSVCGRKMAHLSM